MPYVMVPVPEEHVQDVMQFVLREVAKASQLPWDEESVAQLFGEVDEASRSLLAYAARAITNGTDLLGGPSGRPDAAQAAGGRRDHPGPQRASLEGQPACTSEHPRRLRDPAERAQRREAGPLDERRAGAAGAQGRECRVGRCPASPERPGWMTLANGVFRPEGRRAPQTSPTEAPLPTFIIIGAQKSATRWLRQNLGRHPDIFVPARELKYFNHPKRVDVLGTAWYRAQFDRWAGEAITGEATPGYMMLGHRPAVVAERIQATVPEVRLIALLRNPVDRAYSAFLHHQRAERIHPRARLLDTVRRCRPEDDWMGIIAGGWYAASLGPYVELLRRPAAGPRARRHRGGPRVRVRVSSRPCPSDDRLRAAGPRQGRLQQPRRGALRPSFGRRPVRAVRALPGRRRATRDHAGTRSLDVATLGHCRLTGPMAAGDPVDARGPPSRPCRCLGR